MVWEVALRRNTAPNELEMSFACTSMCVYLWVKEIYVFFNSINMLIMEHSENPEKHRKIRTTWNSIGQRYNP